MTEFKNIKLGDIFEIEKTKGFNKNELEVSSQGKYDYVTRTSLNNGVESITNVIPNRVINKANTFSLGLLQMTFFYRERPWYAGQFVRKITPKFKANKLVMLYLLTYLRSISKVLLAVLVRDVDKTFNNLEVKLPINSISGKLDFQYMEDRVKALEQDRVKALANYLTVTGLNDYQLTDEDKKILEYEPEFHDFNLASSYTLRGKINNVSENGLFDIGPTKKKINANIVKLNGNYPYVARGTNNNGIRGYIDYDTKYLNPDRTISFGQDTATLYYQPIKYFTGDKIQIFKLNSKFERNLNSRIAQYLITVTRKLFSNFSWGQSSFAIDKIAYLKIALPVKQGTTEIDFDYMEKYIKAIQKITIKNVVKYKDKVINETKKVIK